MTGTTRPYTLSTFLLLCVTALPSGAETVYVSNRFEIGVHENTDIDSVIVAVIPSGTPLEVLDRDGEFVEVQTPDGTKGWVDARYVVNDRPGTASVADYDAKLRETVHSLGAARAEVEVLRQRLTELQRDAATASDASRATASAKITKTLAKNDSAAKLAKAEHELETLSKANRELKARVSELKAAQAEAAKSAVEEKAMEETLAQESVWRGPISAEARSWTRWQWLLFASILLLVFAAGGFAVDWESRRRHGGFRV